MAGRLSVVLTPGMDLVPERMPATTQAGNLTLRRLPKAERASLYKHLVCGHLLVTVRETFAVAPGLRSVRAAVLRDGGRDAYGRPRAACLLAARFERAAFDGIQWASADAVAIVNDAATDLVINQRGQASELQPIPLDGEPELARLLAAVDLAQLADRHET